MFDRIRKKWKSSNEIVEEKKRRRIIIEEGLQNEFWKTLCAEMETVAQLESENCVQQLVIGNVRNARTSALLAVAVRKLLKHPRQNLELV